MLACRVRRSASEAFVIRLLFVDDEQSIRHTLSAIFKAKGFDVTTAASVPEALDLISSQTFDCLLSDLNIGEPGDGFTVVSAMRRVQPAACTFILTGYPDFDSALRAIRNQVDDFFSKPADVDTLIKTLTQHVSGGRAAKLFLPVKNVTEVLIDHEDVIRERWLQSVQANPDLASISLSRAERTDHIQGVIAELISGVARKAEDAGMPEVEASKKHGRMRYRQGYTIPQLVCESRILQQTMTTVIEANVLRVDLSTLIHDMLQIGEGLNALLEVSIRAYQEEIPNSLQNSFEGLYKSAHLGAAIASEDGVLDANDAFLRMVGYTREEMAEGAIRWVGDGAAAPPLLEESGFAQLREYGVCVPSEKEYVLRDGTKQPFMIGALRLGSEPFRWAAYVVDLSEHRRVVEVERQARELRAKSALVNQLAHEINNPLAALTFSMHLLQTHSDASEEMKRLVAESAQMLERIATSVRAVLTAGS